MKRRGREYRFTEKEMIKIAKEYFNTDLSAKELAKKYNTCSQTILNIKNKMIAENKVEIPCRN